MIYVLSMRDEAPKGVVVVNTTSRGGEWAGLSPFLIGPCRLPDGRISLTMENAWQYSKVYPQHIREDGEPNADWWTWSYEGFSNPRAVRYPMGKGAVPVYSYFRGERLGYIEARRRLYAPLYTRAVTKTRSYDSLVTLYERETVIALRDFDGYRWDLVHKTTDMDEGWHVTVHDESRKMGHAFVLMRLLSHEGVWDNTHDGLVNYW